MGRYLNSNADGFGKIVNSEIYVDKTGMLSYTNQVLNTMQGYLCVSRPRRFGKSTAANMLTAYYSCGCDSKALFSGFKIAKDKDFEKYLNHYNTISLNMQISEQKQGCIRFAGADEKTGASRYEKRVPGCGLF